MKLELWSCGERCGRLHSLGPGSSPEPPGRTGPGSFPEPPGITGPGSSPEPPGRTGPGSSPEPPGRTGPGSSPEPPGRTGPQQLRDWPEVVKLPVLLGACKLASFQALSDVENV